MPEFQYSIGYVKPSLDSLEKVVKGYLTAAAFTDFDGEGRPPKGAKFAPESILKAASECADFLEQCVSRGLSLDDLSLDQVGADFWFTRNRNGTGFWDRGLGDRGAHLTAVAAAFPEAYVYQADDGLVYWS